MFDENILYDLIGSRICHDLISPLGAIGNGVELLSMSSAGTAPELTLISESIDNANARIRFFRVAFGAASSSTELGEREIRTILADMYRGSRIRIDWRIDRDLPRTEAKLAFLIIQCLESALPWGGRIGISRLGDRWTLTAGGERQKIVEGLWELVSNPDADTQVTPSEVHFALVHAVAERMRRKVRTVMEPGSITVSF